MSEPENDDSEGDLGDFDEFGDEQPDENEQVPDVDSQEAVEEGTRIPKEVADRLRDLNEEVDRLQPVEEENPLDLDPRVGVNDLCFDRAKPGARVYVVDVLAESVPDYYEEFPDAPSLDEYAGNVVTRFTDADAVFACVYVKDSLTSVDTNVTAYPMPESRLTRFPAEQATMVGSSSVEWNRTRHPGVPSKLERFPLEDPEEWGGDEPADDEDEDEDGGDSPGAEDMDLSTALSVLNVHGYGDEVEAVVEAEGLSEEVYGL